MFTSTSTETSTGTRGVQLAVIPVLKLAVLKLAVFEGGKKAPFM
jgi:hypothetical protein